MKKYVTLIGLVTILSLLSSCANGSNDNETDTSNRTISFSNLDVSVENLQSKVGTLENVNLSEDLVISVPKNVSYVSEFVLGSESRINNKDFYDDFIKLYEYLFPERPMTDSCFQYSGTNSKRKYTQDGTIISDYKTIKESYDAIVSDKENILTMFYDENSISDSIDTPVAMMFTSPICNDLARINRGECTKLAGAEINSLFYPQEYFNVVGNFQPDSEERFMLLDKEVSINEAVDFFEEYINSLPYQRNQGLTSTIVSEVVVLSLDNEHYGFNFLTTTAYGNVPFDRANSGEQRHTNKNSENYNYVITTGLMVKSDEVDYVNGITRSHIINDEKRYQEIIPVDDAISVVSSSFTSNVTFNINKVELVYCSKIPDEPITTIESALFSTFPSWKISLYNSNDKMNYICYVNAIDGKNFRYYTTESK